MDPDDVGETLPHRDLLTILDFLRGAGAIGGPRTFAAYVTSELPRVIPSALTAFAEIDLVRRSVHWVMDPADSSLPNAARVLAAHVHDDPYILYRKRTGDAGAVRLSDLITARTFRETGLYRDFYRPLHLQYSMACALRLSQRELAAVALYRSKTDFSSRDRLCLNLLRPHLIQLYRNAEALARLRRDLALVSRGVDAWNHAFLIVSREGRIRRGAERALRWLTRYFGEVPRRDTIPVRLQEWMQGHTTAGRTDALPPVREPLTVEQANRRLTIRLISQPPDTILLLEEARTRLEPAVLVPLGLSFREAEVLAWVAAGKTNPAVAALLHVSSRTVQTHLERIYRKLGVQTRTAAAARALEAVRDEPVDRPPRST
jgi:DNA-binding CsgD family transcriptional regulator